MQDILKRFLQDESGGTAIEYGLIATFIGFGLLVGLTTLRDGLNNGFSGFVNRLDRGS